MSAIYTPIKYSDVLKKPTIKPKPKHRYTKEKLIQINEASRASKKLPDTFLRSKFCLEKITCYGQTRTVWNPEKYCSSKVDYRSWRTADRFEDKFDQQKSRQNRFFELPRKEQEEVDKKVVEANKDKKITQLEQSIKTLTQQINKLTENILKVAENQKDKDSDKENDSGYVSKTNSFINTNSSSSTTSSSSSSTCGINDTIDMLKPQCNHHNNKCLCCVIQKTLDYECSTSTPTLTPSRQPPQSQKPLQPKHMNVPHQQLYQQNKPNPPPGFTQPIQVRPPGFVQLPLKTYMPQMPPQQIFHPHLLQMPHQQMYGKPMQMQFPHQQVYMQSLIQLPPMNHVFQMPMQMPKPPRQLYPQPIHNYLVSDMQNMFQRQLTKDQLISRNKWK